MEIRDSDNQIISKARIKPSSIDYSLLSVWTPELFKFIEDKGLVMSYLRFLDLTVNPNDIDISLPMEWYRHKATPANKASSLAKAIGEQNENMQN